MVEQRGQCSHGIDDGDRDGGRARKRDDYRDDGRYERIGRGHSDECAGRLGECDSGKRGLTGRRDSTVDRRRT